jgi:nitrogenase molybdenum-iron protein beta chain
VQAGYTAFLKAVIGADLVIDKGARDPTLVNVFGLVPGADAAWVGDIEEWSRLLAGIGLRANAVLGPSGGVEDLRRVGNAALTLVLSPAGRGPAEDLQARFGVPWLEAGALPVGASATADLLRRVGDSAGRPRDGVETFVASEIDRENWFLERLSHAYHALDLQRSFALVATGSRAAGLSAFLTGTLGWLPRLIVVAEPLAPEEKTRLLAELDTAAPGGKVIFAESAGEITDAIAAAKPEIILARSIEADIAARLGVPLVQISTPVTDRIVLDTPLSGSRGALALIEAIGTAVLR